VDYLIISILQASDTRAAVRRLDFVWGLTPTLDAVVLGCTNLGDSAGQANISMPVVDSRACLVDATYLAPVRNMHLGTTQGSK
jgi:aspartate/glutamate racemase